MARRSAERPTYVGLAYTFDQKTIVRIGVDAPSGAQRRVFPFTITAQDPTLKHPNAWTGNVTVQRQLPAELSVEVSYVARRGYNNQRKRLRQPGFWESNLSVLRRFRLMNHHSLDVRWEAFNVLNHPTLGGANSNPTSGSFGLVTSKTGSRTMQFVVQYRF
jgi:hypothetical protein